VRELLRAGRRRTRLVVVSHSGARRDSAQSMAGILELAFAKGVPVEEVHPQQLAKRALTASPQGVIALADPLPLSSLGQLAQDCVANAGTLLVLDGVSDPQNLGSIMRSALCSGAAGLVIPRHRSAPLSAAALKAAAGAAEYLPVAVVAGVPSVLLALRRKGLAVVGLDAGAKTSLWDVPLDGGPLAFVLGGEGRGLSPLAARRCQVLAHIPMWGPLDSLNVSAAATLACFEVARRGRPPGSG